MQGNNLLVPAVLAVLAWILLIGVVFRAPRKRSAALRPRRFYRTPFGYGKRWTRDPSDAGEQLHIVKMASFERKRLLNFEEYPVFKIIERDIAAARRGYRVFAQTNLGEVLDSADRDAFHSINSKRVDILIVDKGGWPVVAVEYQGSGHYQGAWEARDAIKKEALEKAGVRYLEVFPNDSAEQIRSRVREQLGWKTRAPMAYAGGKG